MTRKGNNKIIGPAEPLPNPLYIVFCRLCLDPDVANNELAAMLQVLLEVAEKTAADRNLGVCVVRPSPYGRFLGLSQAAKALAAAQQMMDDATARGIRLAIGVAAEERLEAVRDVNQENIIGPTINMAARLAFHPDSPGQILVTTPVAEDAQRETAAYRNCFGPPQDGKVKLTAFQYRVLLRQTGRLPVPPPTAEQLAAVTAVVYDIERFSQRDLDEQRAAFTTLNRLVTEQLQAVGATDIISNARLWYAPAGDGGGMLFETGRADVAWTFAKLLSASCAGQVPIRIGVATGVVVVLESSLPVGIAILRADALSSYPPAGSICVSKAFWQGRPLTERNRWNTVPQTVKLEHSHLLPEAWVLEQQIGGKPQKPIAAKAAPAPKPQPAPQRPIQARPQLPPPVPPIALVTLQDMIAKGLLNALTACYPEQTSATMLLLAVGFPMHYIPSFGNARQAWLDVCQQIEKGASPGTFEPLLARAAQDYPHNPAFAPYKR